MNKKLLAIVALAGATSLNAQVNKVPLVEHFTQASCGPCASQNPTLKATLDAFGTANYVRVSHQVSWPGTDPMNLEFPAGPGDRRTYYGINAVPNTCLNGIANGSPGAPNTVVTSSSLSAQAAVMTPYSISASQSWANANTVTVNIDVTNTTGAAVSDADKIFVSMVEEHVSYPTPPGTNGETDFEYVLRQMYDATTGAAGATSGANLGTIAAGATTNFNFTITSLPSYIRDKGQVAFAVYIQNSSTKEIFQAGKTTIVPIPGLINVAAQSNSTAGAGYCDYSITPAIEFTNNDASTTVTSVEAQYSIDGGTPVSQTFNGSLTNGQSTTITFPATTLNPGTSTVSYEILSVNGGQDWTSPAAVAIPDEVYNKLNASGVAAPVMEGMETAPLASGTGYSREITTGIFDAPGIDIANFSILDGPTYNYGAIGGFAASNRSIRFRFYSVQSGEMNLVMQKVNLGTNSELTFDHAYRQYSSENDRLEVLVSTDCGATWTTVFDKAGSALATLGASTTQYTPAAASDWLNNAIDMSAYDNMNDVIVRFKATSAYGNNMYIDNINLGAATSVNEIAEVNFNVYPNPTQGDITVSFPNAQENTSVEVLNMNGQVVTSSVVNGSQSVELGTTGLASGMYTVRVQTATGISTKKVIVE